MGSGKAEGRSDAYYKRFNLHLSCIITGNDQGFSEPDCTHREKGMDDVRLDRAEGLVTDQHKDLLLLLQADKVAEPGPLSQPENKQFRKVIKYES